MIENSKSNWTNFVAGDCETRQSLMSRPGGLTTLCSEIPGDTAMYSMIRLWSKPVQCPIQVKNIDDKLFLRKLVVVSKY